MEMNCVTAVCALVSWLLFWRLSCEFVDWFENWRNHFVLAAIISDWHRDGLRSKMKAKGIKFSPRPLSPPLKALPCKWMVLSCVMMSMWSVAMAGHVVKQPPVTWVVAVGSVRDLKHPFLPPPKPPEPLKKKRKPPDKSSPDGEGREPENVNQLKPVEPFDH